MNKTTLTVDRVLTERQAKIMFKETRRESDNAINTGKNSNFITDHFLFSIAFYTGLRVSEIANLRWRDIQDDIIIVRSGKGSKARNVIIGNKVIELLSEYQQIQQRNLPRKMDNADKLFLGKRGPLTRSGIHARTKYWIRRLGLPESLSFHSFRHGAATRWLDYGIPLSNVRDQLGHSNISTTSVYLHFTKEARERFKAIS